MTRKAPPMIMKTNPFWPIALILALLGFSSLGIAEDKVVTKTISIATLAPPGSTWMKV